MLTSTEGPTDGLVYPLPPVHVPGRGRRFLLRAGRAAALLSLLTVLGFIIHYKLQSLPPEDDWASRKEAWYKHLEEHPGSADEEARADAARTRDGERLRIQEEQKIHRDLCSKEHIEQLRDGTVEGVASGRLCWYCKKPHAWAECPSR